MSSVRSKKVQVISTIALIAGVLALGASGGENTDSSSVGASSRISRQIRQDINDSLRMNGEARDHEEWHESGFTPEDILAQAKALKDPAALRAVCDSLLQLPPRDLSLFEDAVSHEKSLECRDEVLNRVQSYWLTARIRFNSARLESQGRSVPAGVRADRVRPQLRPLPLLEMRIDPAATPSLVSADLKPGEVAITLDDGPHATRTEKILEIFREAGVRATYFQVGKNARAMPELSKRVAEEGHSVGSHSYSHPQLPKLAVGEAEHEIVAGRDAVALASGVQFPFFRFPYGSSNRVLRGFVKEEGLASFLWNMDSLDWKIRDPEALFKNVLRELDREKGGILLFHDVHEQTVIVLPWLLDELARRNYTLVVFIK